MLVVEDSAECAATIEMALAPLPGIEVRVTRTAEEGLRVVEESEPAAVITDIQLPGMDGLQLVARLRGDGRYARLPILVISGASGREVFESAMTAGASAYFSKPFSPGAVRQKLEALIESP